MSQAEEIMNSKWRSCSCSCRRRMKLEAREHDLFYSECGGDIFKTKARISRIVSLLRTLLNSTLLQTKNRGRSS